MQKLAFVYLNAGLFGIPVVAGIWGDEAVRVYIGAYIGNSIMGNILGTSLLRGDSRAESGEGSPPRTATALSRGDGLARLLTVGLLARLLTVGLLARLLTVRLLRGRHVVSCC